MGKDRAGDTYLETLALHHISTAHKVGSCDRWKAHGLADPHFITSWTEQRLGQRADLDGWRVEQKTVSCWFPLSFPLLTHVTCHPVHPSSSPGLPCQWLIQFSIPCAFAKVYGLLGGWDRYEEQRVLPCPSKPTDKWLLSNFSVLSTAVTAAETITEILSSWGKE